MIPLIGNDGWFLIPLPPTRFAPAKLAKVKVSDDRIVSAFALERRPSVSSITGYASRRLHWAEGIGSWAEVA